MSDPRVRDCASDARLLSIAKEILGERCFPFRATFFDKSPTANWLVVWHQDTALPLREKHDQAGWNSWSTKEGILYAHAPAEILEKIVALRLHFDDSDAENGPLRVLPGTHKLGLLDDDRIVELSRQITPHDCVATAGSVIAMSPLIVHSSSKSELPLSRRVLHIEYAGAELRNLPLAVA